MAQERHVRRLQIDLTEMQYARLERLQHDTDAASLTEVVRDALKVREQFLKLRGEGKEIFAVDPQTGERERLLPL